MYRITHQQIPNSLPRTIQNHPFLHPFYKPKEREERKRGNQRNKTQKRVPPSSIFFFGTDIEAYSIVSQLNHNLYSTQKPTPSLLNSTKVGMAPSQPKSGKRKAATAEIDLGAKVRFTENVGGEVRDLFGTIENYSGNRLRSSKPNLFFRVRCGTSAFFKKEEELALVEDEEDDFDDQINDEVILASRSKGMEVVRRQAGAKASETGWKEGGNMRVASENGWKEDGNIREAIKKGWLEGGSIRVESELGWLVGGKRRVSQENYFSGSYLTEKGDDGLTAKERKSLKQSKVMEQLLCYGVICDAQVILMVRGFMLKLKIA